MRTPKHIHDAIRSALRFVTKDLTLPQTRAVKEILLGFLTHHTPVLNEMNRDASIRVGKQSERHRRHLGAIDITGRIEERIFRTLPEVGEDDVLSYDLGDIAKPRAKKMEGMSGIFDGSERKPSRGYALHGVSVLNQPLVLEVHDVHAKTLNQTRLAIIDRVLRNIGRKGIWVFDRQNDDEKLFAALSGRKLRFVIRLRKNRKLLHRSSGMCQKVEDFLPGIYDVRLPQQRRKYVLVVSEHHEHNDPIRVLVRKVPVTTAKEIIDLYLVRWEIENLYKQMKEKFQLEKVRVLSLRKLKNLLALIQLATSISNGAFATLVEEEAVSSTASFELSVTFKAFCHHQCLTQNRFAFTSFLSTVAPELCPRDRTTNHLQRSLFPRHLIRAWGRETAEMGVS